MPRRARGRGRGPRGARVRGGRGWGIGARGRGGQPGASREGGEGAQLVGQEGSVVLPGNMWDSLLIIIRPVQVDGGVLRLQIADGGTSQEKEDTSSQDSQEEEEEAGVNSQEGTAEELELDL